MRDKMRIGNADIRIIKCERVKWFDLELEPYYSFWMCCI